MTDQPSAGVSAWNLDGKVFVVERNDGVDAQLPPGSLFRFRQSGHNVTADYSGGKVSDGRLEGRIAGSALAHRYRQRGPDGRIYEGEAHVTIARRSDGLVELHDDWEWADGRGRGSCVMVEVKTSG